MSDFSSCTSFVMVTDGNSFVMEDDAETFSMTGSNGTTDYTKLQNKPSINGVTLEGNKTSEELGLLTEDDLADAVDPIKEELDTKAPVVTKTNGADFLDGADMPMKSLVVNIEPQQDLHGYDAPWAGGNGKNLFGTDDIDRLHKGVTFKSETDSAGNRIGVKLTGAYSGETATATLGYATLSAGSYKVSGGDENVQLSIRPGSSSAAQIGQVTTGETTITLESATDIYLIARVVGAFTSGVVIKPMIRLASVTDATFAPYSNICPITGWTGLNGSVVGKNWLPNNLTFTDGLRDDNGNQTSSAYSHYSEPFLIRPNTLYRATGTIWVSGINPRIYFLDADKNWISRTDQFYQQAFTFTTPENCCYIQVQCSKDVDLTAGMISHDQSVAVTPYNGNTFSISWETEAGTVYSGTVDPIKGTLTVDKKGITFDGSSDETWQLVNTANRAYIAVSDIITTVSDNSIVDLKSNQYKADGYNYSGRTRITGRYNIAQINVFDYNILVGSNYSELLAKWQAHLSEHPLQVIYPLATPIVYTLTPTEIRSLLGENHVTVDAGSIESLVYCVDTAVIIERIDEDLAALDGRVDTLEDEMDTAQDDITSLETAVEQLDTDIEAVDAKVDKKAPAIYSTASGDIASFSDGADDMPMASVVATITPKQNLNGYDHPWVGGAGNNLLPPVESGTTINGVTFAVDEQGVVTATGTASGGVAYVATQKITLQANTAYILSGCPASGGMSSYRIDFRNATDASQLDTELANVFDIGSGVTFTPTTTHEVRIGLRIANEYALPSGGITFKPMIRLASVSDSTYEPYENICPIEGYTGMRTTVRGKNLWKLGGDFDSLWFNNMAVGATGKLTASTTNARANIVKVNSGEQFVTSGFDLTQYSMSSVIRVFVTKEYPGAGVDAYRLANALNNSVITIPSGYNWLVCLTYVNTGVTLDMPAQLEYGTTPTDYEEYAGSTTTVSWQTEAGTVYSGTVDAVSGKLTVDRALKVLDGTSLISDFRSYAGSVGYNSGSPQFPNADYSKPILCNKLVTIGPSDSQRFGACKYANVSFYFWFQNEAFTDEDDAKAKVAAANIQCLYYLASPIVHQLSPQQIKTLYAQNHVWTDVGEVSLTYPTDTKLYVDNLFASIPTASGVSF